MLKAHFETNREWCFKEILMAFAQGFRMEGCVLSFESVNWLVGLCFVAAAKSVCICLDLILKDKSPESPLSALSHPEQREHFD